MIRHKISDGATIYTRVTKKQARKMFDEGKPFYAIAHKMRPGMPFSMGMTIYSDAIAKENAERAKYPSLTLHTFDSVMRDFCWYNANCHETGYYPAFYTMTVDSKSEKIA